MTGVDKDFEGIALPMPGVSVGYLPQEPGLVVVLVNIDLDVLKGQEILDRFTELSNELAGPMSYGEMQKVMNELEEVQAKIGANDLWEQDRSAVPSIIWVLCICTYPLCLCVMCFNKKPSYCIICNCVCFFF